jgi:hypothetical protein
MPTWAILLFVFGGLGALCLGAGVVMTLTADTPPRAGSGVAAAPTTATTTRTTPPAAPKTVVVKLGETLVMTSLGDEIHFTLAADKQYKTSLKYGMKPDNGTYYAVAATIEAKKGSAYACSCDFALVARDGTVYEPGSGFGWEPKGLAAVQLNAGQKASGLVIFDVPPAALAGAKIELREGLFSSGDDGYWQL